MSTFKITVDDESELGRHLCSLSPKARSREVYLLGTLGLKFFKGDSVTEQSVTSALKSDETVVKQSLDSKRDRSPNVHVGNEGENNISKLIQGNSVDFGDEIAYL